MNKPFFVAILLILLISCKEENKKEYVFSKPHVVFLDTVDRKKVLFESTSIETTCSLFCGKYKSSDSVSFNYKKVFYRDSIFQKDGGYMSFAFDTFDTEGFKIVTDYSQEVLFNWWATESFNTYYPAFIFNPSTKPKTLLGKDDRVFAIQEAKDGAGIWRPIESRGIDFCGVGNWQMRFYPKEFGVFLLPKYKGDFKTKLRVRMKIGKTIYVSEEFEGTINKRQFLIKTLVKENKEAWKETINEFFFGSIPVELDSILPQ